MQAPEVADRAEAFLACINSFDSRLQARQVSIERDAGLYRDIFRMDGPKAVGGTYWFYRPDGAVFYIGKAEASLWNRITHHPGVAEWHGDKTADYEGTTGEGWGFPRYEKLDSSRVGAATKEAILNGRFHVGWVAVEPWTAALLLEVYLQALCVAVDRDLPEFCDKLG